MSTKNNALIGVAAAALGMVVLAGASPVCEGLLNDLVVTEFGAAEVDTNGRVLVLVTVGGVVRPVADAAGNARLYVDGNAAVALAKRSNILAGVMVKFVKMEKAGTVGDPIVALKAKYKKYKAEAVSSLKQSTALAAKKSAAIALGWDTAMGTPENLEYLDLDARVTSVAEWAAFNDGKVASLAASLTAAGIDPATVI